MAWLFEQIIALLSTEAGSMTYHLVLAFSIAGALQISLAQRSRAPSKARRREILGLSFLLIVQVGLFICSGLAWQGLIDGELWLPLLDRGVTLVMLVAIIWLWCFPMSNPGADAASMIVGFLALIGSFFGALWWLRVSAELGISEAPLNGSAIDLNFQIAALILIGIGLLLLLADHPVGMGNGLAMLLLMTAGHAAHLLLLPYPGDYPYALRLFQMAAFPFLLLIPQRSGLSESTLGLIEDQAAEGQALTGEGDSSIESGHDQSQVEDYQLFAMLFGLIEETEPRQVCRRLVSILAQAGKADHVFLVSPPDGNGNMHILCGLDKSAGRYMESSVVDGRSFPILSSCTKMGRIRRLPASSASPDRLSLGRLYGLEQDGAMLFVPVLTPEGVPLQSAILVSTNGQNDWSADEQSMIGGLAKFLVQFLQKTLHANEMQHELENTRQAARRVQDQAQLVYLEERKLRDQLAALQERSEQDRAQLVQMTTVIGEHALFQQKMDELNEENERLWDRLKQAQESAGKKVGPLTGELRLALEEISLLRTAVAEAEARLTTLEFSPSHTDLSSPQLDNIVSLAEELRQPLSSIIGYTDLLLGESTGILGSNQRKFLDRIKLSTRRFGRLLDELLQVSMSESDPTRVDFQEIDIRSIINDSLRETDGLFQLRHLVLRTRLPEKPLLIQSDREALRKIITQLLRNAATANPEGGEVGVNAWLEGSNQEKAYVLIQISDKGPGIPVADLPLVFNPKPGPYQIRGLGSSGVDFLRIKTLVEMLGGRTWVDSDAEHGSVFSILLPAVPERDGHPVEENNP